MGLLFDAEVHHLEDAFIAHVGLVDTLFFSVLLAMGEDVLPNLTEAFVAEFVDEVTEAIFGNV